MYDVKAVALYHCDINDNALFSGNTFIVEYENKTWHYLKLDEKIPSYIKVLNNTSLSNLYKYHFEKIFDSDDLYNLLNLHSGPEGFTEVKSYLIALKFYQSICEKLDWKAFDFLFCSPEDFRITYDNYINNPDLVKTVFAPVCTHFEEWIQENSKNEIRNLVNSVLKECSESIVDTIIKKLKG